MSKKEQVEQLTNYMANFVDHIGKVLPDDIIKKLDELAEKEDSPLSKTIYKTMKENQKLAKELNRPSCQDTGVPPSVLGKMWNKLPIDRRTGTIIKRSSSKSYIPGTTSSQQC